MINITSVEITPNPVNANTAYMIQVSVIEGVQTWQELKDNLTSWTAIMSDYNTWQELSGQ